MKRICILMLSLVILFASYSCAQKTGTGPKGKEYTLKLAVDYYGTGAIDSSAISVKVYKTKEDVESEEVESEYTGLDFADETKPVSIIENYEVVITLNKTLDGDSTYISGDVPDEFDSTSGELQFTMDGDKTFSITFSKAPIKKIKYTFKVGLNGGINVAVEGGANYNIGANSSKEIEFLEAEIKASKVKATANPNTLYLFEKWTAKGNNSKDNPLTITSAMEGTITANFFIPDYGTGTAPNKVGDWYEIKTKEHLIYVAKQVNTNNATFKTNKYKLMADIDYGGDYHLPIGTGADVFNGIIDGNDRTIKNAKFGVSSSGSYTYTGFIADLGVNGVVSNLIIDSSCTIDSSAYNVGSIVAQSAGGSIYNSVNKANIKAYGSMCTGGIVGFGHGSISNVYNTGNIYLYSVSDSYVGGVVAYAGTGPLYLINAYNTGNIYKEGWQNCIVGGVIGQDINGLYITNVYNTGTINNITLYNTGGVIGMSGYRFINGGVAGIDATNVYFTGNNSLPAHGFAGDSGTNAGVFGRIGSLSGLESTFNKAIPNSWEAGPNNRPIIVGLPAE